jgi:hypothetical protein
MASLYDVTKGEEMEFFRLLSRAGFTAELLRAFNKMPETASVVVAVICEQIVSPPRSDLEKLGLDPDILRLLLRHGVDSCQLFKKFL